MNSLLRMDEPCQAVEKACYEPSIRQSLEAQKKHLEERLDKVNKGLAVLDSDPNLALNLELLTKALRA